MIIGLLLSSLVGLSIHLNEYATGFSEPTDIQFLPSGEMLILEKGGSLKIFDHGKIEVIKNFDVLTKSEEGLLGLCLHPQYSENSKVYVNRVLSVKNKDTTRIAEWILEKKNNRWVLRSERILLEVAQPFANHNAGQLAFGPDHFLYIGFGDGGSGNDPYDAGQNMKTLLGKMLRIDPTEANGKAYQIPKDNPFQNEIFAFGLRNPWRYSFSPDEKLVVADVGQDRLEEVDIVERGKNYGWNIFEASLCLKDKDPRCQTIKNVEKPVIEYGRSSGGSITGGFVYTGSKLKNLKNKYLFGDFLSGRIWAQDWEQMKSKVTQSPQHLLGQWPINISTFGRDFIGEIYVADFGSGKIFKIDE